MISLRIAAIAFSLLIVSFGPTFAASRVIPLHVETIVIDSPHGPHQFRMEIADTPASRERGLMYRKHLPRDSGMLFDLGRPLMCAFWMKDTYIPLDMLFVRADGHISTIATNATPLSSKEIVSAESVRAVIELNGGRARVLGIAPGDLVHATVFGTAAKSNSHHPFKRLPSH